MTNEPNSTVDMSLVEATTTARQCFNDVVYTPCTECQGSGWSFPDRPCNDLDDMRSQGPHCKCSELSMTPENQNVWQTVRYLPGVWVRDRRDNRPDV